MPADRTLVMGILNVTPDSFSDGGWFFDADVAIAHARRMADEGADIIDVGGESTRPGAAAVSADEELRRVLPVIEAIAGAVDVPVSVDTRKPEVARACLAAGAVMVNDVTGLDDRGMLDAVVQHRAGLAIMHMRGTPDTMMQETHYDDLVGEVRAFLVERANMARRAGVETVFVDPGIGFAKEAAQNLVILNRLDEFANLGYPLLLGPSRKAFIGKLTGRPADDRLGGTVAAVVTAVFKGARVVRVHDVAACKQAVVVADAILRAKG